MKKNYIIFLLLFFFCSTSLLPNEEPYTPIMKALNEKFGQDEENIYNDIITTYKNNNNILTLKIIETIVAKYKGEGYPLPPLLTVVLFFNAKKYYIDRAIIKCLASKTIIMGLTIAGLIQGLQQKWISSGLLFLGGILTILLSIDKNNPKYFYIQELIEEKNIILDIIHQLEIIHQKENMLKISRL